MVKADLEVCPNCSHPFPIETPAVQKSIPMTGIEPPKTVQAIGRPFKFILLFLLSFIAVLVFILAEGGKLNGSGNTSYLLGDVIWVTLVAIGIAVVLMFIEYMLSD